MKFKKTIAAAAVCLAGAGAYLMLPDEQPDDMLDLYMTAVLPAIIASRDKCLPAESLPHEFRVDEYSSRSGDPNGLRSDAPLTLLAFAGDTILRGIGVDSPYAGSQDMMQKIMDQTGEVSTALYGRDEIVDKIAEVMQEYCAEHRLIITAGNELNFLEDTIRKYPELPWKENITVIVINGSNITGGNRPSYEYVLSVLGFGLVEVIAKDDFVAVFKPNSSCTESDLNRIQGKLDAFQVGVCDTSGECLDNPSHWYQTHQRFLNGGQIQCPGCRFRGADVVAVCRAAGYSLTSCRDACWLETQF